MKQGFLIFFISISIALLAQKETRISFIIYNSSGKEGVSFAKIANRTSNEQYVCDENGRAIITVQDSSLIKISAIGFHSYYYFVGKTPPDSVSVILNTKVYELKELSISPYPTIALFKRAFEDLELDDSSFLALNLAPILFMQAKKEIRTNYNPQEFVSISFSSPISAFYNLYSKKVKSLSRLHQLKGMDFRKKEVYKRYNPQLVKAITGIQEDGELKKIMDFCKPSDGFILASSDYEIALFIISCYQDFVEYKEQNE